MTRLLLRHLLPIMFIIFLPSGGSSAEEQDLPSPTIDALERQLELNRHEQLAAIKSVPGNSVDDFTTDGCSGGLSVGWTYLAANVGHIQAVHGSNPPWESCCISHDEIYHTAGSPDDSALQSFEARKEADLVLRRCVIDTGVRRTPELIGEYGISKRDIEIIYSAVADLMYRAVRIGGVPCTSLPWRWGYGWPECD